MWMLYFGDVQSRLMLKFKAFLCFWYPSIKAWLLQYNKVYYYAILAAL